METSDEPQLPPVFFATKDIADAQAITDAGRPIPLIRYEAVAILPQGQQLAFHSAAEEREFLAAVERQFLVNTRQDAARMTRLLDSFTVSNCHGWVFLGGQCGIDETQVPAILADNGYAAVSQPQPDDLVLFSRGGQVKHSGIVRLDADGAALVESKWGPFSVFLHGLDAQPFGDSHVFYRSPRGGHSLTVTPR